MKESSSKRFATSVPSEKNATSIFNMEQACEEREFPRAAHSILLTDLQGDFMTPLEPSRHYRNLLILNEEPISSCHRLIDPNIFKQEPIELSKKKTKVDKELRTITVPKTEKLARKVTNVKNN